MNKRLMFFSFVLTSLLVTSLVSCQNPDRKANPNSPGADTDPGSKSAGGGGPGSAGGTSDTGGGNGCNGKMYESYIVNPTELPAYKKYVQPMIENIERQQDDKDGNKGGFALYFKLKTWYVSCVDLKPLDKETLGVSFDKNETEQIAIQKDREIWISDRLFKAMPEEDQAIVIRHEFLMSLYFLKFKSMEELCRIFNEISNEKRDCSLIPAFAKHLPPSPLRPLNTVDYQNIRRVENFLRTEGNKASLAGIYAKMSENGFDARIFGGDTQVTGTSNLKITGLDLSGLISKAKLSNNLPSQCYFVQSQKTEACALSIEETKETGDLSSFRLATVSPSLPAGSFDFRTNRIHLPENMTLSVSNLKTADGAGTTNYMVTLWEELKINKQGDLSAQKFQYVFIFLRKVPFSGDKPEFMLDAISTIPVVLIPKAGDKNHLSMIAVQPTKTSENAIVLHQDGANIAPYISTIELYLNTMK